MNVNVAQLNIKQIDNENLKKINVKINEESELVDFKSVLANLLGMSMDFEMPTEENQVKIKQPLMIDSENTKMILTNEHVDQRKDVYSLLSDLSLKANNENLEMTLANGYFNKNDTKIEPPQFEIFKELIKSTETELGVKEIIATSGQKDVEFTSQSYHNMLKIKFRYDKVNKNTLQKATTEEINREGLKTEVTKLQMLGLKKEIIMESDVQVRNVGETIGSDITKKSVGIEKKIENDETRKSTGLKFEDEKMINTERPLTFKMDSGSVKLVDNAKDIGNGQEVKEAMIESIKETQKLGVSKIKVMLKPKEMGNLEIELKMQNGKINGEIKVLNADMKNQIEQLVIPIIKETLKEQNIIFRDFQVTVFDKSFEGEFSNKHNMDQRQYAFEHDYRYEEIGQEIQEIQGIQEIQNDEKGLNLLA